MSLPLRLPALSISLVLSLAACASDKSDDSGVSGDSGSTGADCEESVGALCTAWILNEDDTQTAVLLDGDRATIAVNVQSVSLEDGGSLVRVQATGVPSYEVTVDQDVLDSLNSRPLAEADFLTGASAVSLGEVISFGQDVGYASNDTCVSGGGYGYWPPGPSCPEAAGHDYSFPVSPAPAGDDDTCETGAGAVGLWVNGVSIYNWGDTFSYENQGVWSNLAPELEVYDADLCKGHAAGIDYHHHSVPDCVVDLVGDTGSGHSPVIGFAADGYPVHGPWVASGQEAESCWQQRDYDDPEDPYGCGGTGTRSCLMVDALDPSLGTETATSNGPSTSDSVTSLSGNVFPGTQGLFLEDYWYDAACTAASDIALDEHNGHDHDGLGYHYHVTQGFPYIVGPTLYGAVPADSDFSCGGMDAGPGGGGPGGGPG